MLQSKRRGGRASFVPIGFRMQILASKRTKQPREKAAFETGFRDGQK
jgi:hypothetical protein